MRRRAAIFHEERLRQVVIGTEIQPLDFFRQSRARSHENDRHRITPFAQRPQDAQPVPAGHHDIEHERIIRGVECALHRRIAIPECIHAEAHLLETLFCGGEKRWLILEEKNAHGGNLADDQRSGKR